MMTEEKIKELQIDIDEMKDILRQARRKGVQDLLTLEVKKFERELADLIDTAKAEAAAAAAAPPTSSSAVPKRYEIKLNGYGWDQSDKYLKIFVTLKDIHRLPKDQVYCKLTERSMELHVENLDNKNYVLVINKLLEPIVVQDSHWKQKTDMVVVFLAKSNQGSKWSHITQIEKKFEDQKHKRFKADDNKDKQDPQESIMSLMRNMYETGDDDMKRMISKAWYEGQQKKKNTDMDVDL